MKRTPLPGTAGTRKPGVTMPARFTGSTAGTQTRSPLRSSRRTRAQGVDGLGQGVLLADEAGDEAAAADEAARFEAAQGAQDVAPGQGEALALVEVAEDDAVAMQQDARDGSRPARRRVGIGGASAGAWTRAQRPAGPLPVKKPPGLYSDVSRLRPRSGVAGAAES